jgi:Rod binding domain-containing protein
MASEALNSTLATMRLAPQHEIFGQAKHSLAGDTAAQHAQIVDQVRKWVGLSFFGTMMKQMRQSPFRSQLMDGGRGGEAFGEMYDQQLAQRMGKGAGSKLINSIVKKIEAGKAYSKQSQTAKAFLHQNHSPHHRANTSKSAGPMAAMALKVPVPSALTVAKITAKSG